MELRGRVALVTGAGRRLGRAFAWALAGRGMTMAIHYHASEGAPRPSRGDRGAGGRAECFHADLGDAQAARALAGRVAEKLGRLDVLVNSAAVMHHLELRGHHARAVRRDPRPQSPLGILRAQGAAAALRKARGKIVNLADLGVSAVARLRGALGQQGRRDHVDHAGRAWRRRSR